MLQYLGSIIAAILALCGLYFSYKNKVENKTLLFLFVLVFFSCSFQMIQIYQQNRIESYFQYTGSIKSVNIEIPAIKCGDAIFQFPDATLENPVYIHEDLPFRVWLDKGKLQLYVVIRDQNNNIAASIFGTQFDINSDFIFDYNYDDMAIEVLDENHDVILQAIMEDDGVQLRCKLYLEDGNRVGFGNNVIEYKPKGEPLQLSFEPIFRYPGKDHLGERLLN